MKRKKPDWFVKGAKIWHYDARGHFVEEVTAKDFNPNWGVSVLAKEGEMTVYPDRIFPDHPSAVRYARDKLKADRDKLKKSLASAQKRLEAFIDLHSDIIEHERGP